MRAAVKETINWDAEDLHVSQKLREVATEIWFSFPNQWHVDHPHVKSWTETTNGQATIAAQKQDIRDPAQPRACEYMPEGFLAAQPELGGPLPRTMRKQTPTTLRTWTAAWRS